MDEVRFYIHQDNMVVWCSECYMRDDDHYDDFAYGYLGYPEDRLTCSQCDAVIQIK